MGRKRADVWNEFEESDKDGSFKARRVRCIHCGHEFTAHANRMKEHLRDCPQYKEVGFVVQSNIVGSVQRNCQTDRSHIHPLRHTKIHGIF